MKAKPAALDVILRLIDTACTGTGTVFIQSRRFFSPNCWLVGDCKDVYHRLSSAVFRHFAGRQGQLMSERRSVSSAELQTVSNDIATKEHQCRNYVVDPIFDGSASASRG